MQLDETEQKLEEAEQQCEDLTKSVFAACQPCLEETRKAFYTSKCRRGFTLFSFKVWAQHILTVTVTVTSWCCLSESQVEELFRKSATLRHVYNHEVTYLQLWGIQDCFSHDVLPIIPPALEIMHFLLSFLSFFFLITSVSQHEAVTEIEEMNMLLKASCQQYTNQLLLVQGYTEDTQRWLSNMADQYEWISWLFSSRRSSQDIFSMITVSLSQVVLYSIKPQEVGVCMNVMWFQNTVWPSGDVAAADEWWSGTWQKCECNITGFCTN